MDGTEAGWQIRFLTAGVPLVMLAEPKPLVGPGIFTSPLRGKHWALVSPLFELDMLTTGAGSAHGIIPLWTPGGSPGTNGGRTHLPSLKPPLQPCMKRGGPGLVRRRRWGGGSEDDNSPDLHTRPSASEIGHANIPNPRTPCSLMEMTARDAGNPQGSRLSPGVPFTKTQKKKEEEEEGRRQLETLAGAKTQDGANPRKRRIKKKTQSFK